MLIYILINPTTYNLRLQILSAHRPEPLVHVDVPLGYHLQTRGGLPVIQVVQNSGRCLYRRTALLKDDHAVFRRLAHRLVHITIKNKENNVCLSLSRIFGAEWICVEITYAEELYK